MPSSGAMKIVCSLCVCECVLVLPQHERTWAAHEQHLLASLSVSDCCSSCTFCCASNSCAERSSNSASTSTCGADQLYLTVRLF